MSFFKKLFGGKEEKLTQPQTNIHAEFWQWFQQNQKDFHRIINGMNRETIEREFFDKLSLELEKVHKGIFFLTGGAGSSSAFTSILLLALCKFLKDAVT